MESIETRIIKDVRNYAIKKHGDQMYGKKPYIYHLDKTYEVAVRYGLSFRVQKCCYLHDDLEDNGTPLIDLVKEFGEKVADIVYCVTDEEGSTRKERKRKTYKKTATNVEAIQVKLCDRIANVRECIRNNNLNLYKMYQKEQEEFRKHLYKADFSEMFEELEILLDDLIGGEDGLSRMQKKRSYNKTSKEKNKEFD